VADDLVFVRRTESQALVVCAKQGAQALLSIRGVGLVVVAKIYGAQSVVSETTPKLVIEIAQERSANDYDLLGMDKKTKKILGVPVTHVVLPPNSPELLATKIELVVKKKSLSS
jgi:serine kinase of HPr protein (carbohydrate metabolism regulator)